MAQSAVGCIISRLLSRSRGNHTSRSLADDVTTECDLLQAEGRTSGCGGELWFSSSAYCFLFSCPNPNEFFPLGHILLIFLCGKNNFLSVHLLNTVNNSQKTCRAPCPTNLQSLIALFNVGKVFLYHRESKYF